MEEELAKRVQQLLYERKDEIEAEVLRRVEEAKKVGLHDGSGRSLRGLSGRSLPGMESMCLNTRIALFHWPCGIRACYYMAQ